MSSLASVVSEGSPGSSVLIVGKSAGSALSAARVRGRLLDCLVESIELFPLRCFTARAGESSASSPDASRDEGCCDSAADGFKYVVLLLDSPRFRLLELAVEDGDDMVRRGSPDLDSMSQLMAHSLS